MYVQDLEIARRKLWYSNHLGRNSCCFSESWRDYKVTSEEASGFPKALSWPIEALLEELGAILQKMFPNLDAKITIFFFFYFTFEEYSFFLLSLNSFSEPLLLKMIQARNFAGFDADFITYLMLYASCYICFLYTLHSGILYIVAALDQSLLAINEIKWELTYNLVN